MWLFSCILLRWRVASSGYLMSVLLKCRRTVKNIPKYASAQWYVDNVLPRIKEKAVMALKPFVDRLGYGPYPGYSPWFVFQMPPKSTLYAPVVM